MSKQSLMLIEKRLTKLLANVGDIALKRRAMNIIKSLDLKSKDKILDLGCGNGYYLYLLKGMNSKLNLVGLDNDKNAIESIKENIKGKVKLILGDVKKLPFRDNYFDKVLASEVIEHIDDEKKIIAEAYRVLKPRGIFVLTTCDIDYPFFWDPVNWILKHCFNTHIKSGFWAGIWNQHLRLYKKNYLEKILKDANFRVARIESLTFWCLPFNHYLVNCMARLFYGGKLPKNISRGIDKFAIGKQDPLLRLIFWVVNKVDYLNDLFPQNGGVSIFIKAVKA